MFEVGREYLFHIVEDSPGQSGVVEQVWSVDRYEGTLLKLSNPYTDPIILNTASPRFVKAVLRKETASKSRPVSRERERWTELPPD